MKKIILLLAFSITTFSFSQEQNKFEFSVSYGVAYSNFFGYRAEVPAGITVNELDIRTTDFGSIIEFNFDYALRERSFIGVGFARQQHSKNIDQQLLMLNPGISLVNYRAIDQNVFYDIHYRKEFKNRIHLTLGLFYYKIYYNGFRFYSDGTNQIYEFKNDKQRADNIGLSLALDYFIPIKNYLELGLRGKVYYSFVGVETISLSPIIKISF